MKLILHVFTFLLISNVIYPQAPIAEYDRANNDPCVSLASFSDPNATASTLCRTAATSQASGGDFNSNGWDAATEAAAIVNNEYYTFAFTPNPGFTASITELNYRLDRSETGPTNYLIRSSLDAFAANIASGTISTSGGNFSTAVSLSIPNGTAVEFRIYAYGASNTSVGTMDVEGTTFTGSATLADPGIQLVGTVNAVVPVTYDKFHLTNLENKNNLLNWVTASESNNDYFDIQMSINGLDFTSIGEVKGNNHSTRRNEYSFEHKNPQNGTNYYRLKQMDYDGQFEYSEILSIRNSSDVRGFTISPNPTKSGQFNLNIQNAEDAVMVLYNFMGMEVFRKNIQASTSKIDVTNLSSGTYLVSVEANGIKSTQRIIVQ